VIIFSIKIISERPDAMAVYQFNINPFGLFFIGIEMRSDPFKLLKYLLKKVIKRWKKCKVVPPTIIFTINFA
jgi:hypothetical protein